MANRYVSTSTSIYSDPDLRPWHPMTIYFYRYLYENDHVHGITGIGQIAIDIMLHEAKLTKKQFEKAKEQMGSKVVWFDEHTYWVVGRAKHTCYTNTGIVHPKFSASARNFVNGLPKHIRNAFAGHYPDIIANTTPSERQSNGDQSATERQSNAVPTLTTESVNESVAVSESVKEEKLFSPTPPSKPGNDHGKTTTLQRLKKAGCKEEDGKSTLDDIASMIEAYEADWDRTVKHEHLAQWVDRIRATGVKGNWILTGYKHFALGWNRQKGMPRLRDILTYMVENR